MKITVEEAKEFANKCLPTVSDFHNDVLELMRQFAQEQVNKAIEEYKEKSCIDCKFKDLPFDQEPCNSCQPIVMRMYHNSNYETT
jgi:hypothetical protein